MQTNSPKAVRKSIKHFKKGELKGDRLNESMFREITEEKVRPRSHQDLPEFGVGMESNINPMNSPESSVISPI